MGYSRKHPQLAEAFELRRGLDEAGVVRGGHGLVRAQRSARLVRAREHIPAETLRGLHGRQVGAPRRTRDEARGVHGLERVADGQDGDDGARAGAHRVDDARGDLRGRQGASRVVHEDDRVRLTLTESGKSQGHGLLTRTIGADDDAHAVNVGQGGAKSFDRRGRGRHDDRPHSPGA